MAQLSDATRRAYSRWQTIMAELTSPSLAPSTSNPAWSRIGL